MATAIAHAYGAEVKEVLTGFKYIGEAIDAQQNQDDYIMGMEESYGYLVGRHARDKDAVSATMMIVEMASYYRAQGKTLIDVLNVLYEQYGFLQHSTLFENIPRQEWERGDGRHSCRAAEKPVERAVRYAGYGGERLCRRTRRTAEK